jgi:hypothetical protein
MGKLRAYQGFSDSSMSSAAGLFFGSIMVAILTYTKPSFFWNAPKMRRARQHLTEAQAEKLSYTMTLVLAMVGLVAMRLGH